MYIRNEFSCRHKYKFESMKSNDLVEHDKTFTFTVLKDPEYESQLKTAQVLSKMVYKI